MQGKPQKFGTQFRQDQRTGKFVLAPCEPGVKEEERQALGLPPIAETLALLQKQMGGAAPEEAGTLTRRARHRSRRRR
jgi:hypothetical protein